MACPDVISRQAFFFVPGSTKFLVGFGIILFLIEFLFRFGYVDVLLESCLVYSWLVM